MIGMTRAAEPFHRRRERRRRTRGRFIEQVGQDLALSAGRTSRRARPCRASRAPRRTRTPDRRG
ncbi:MAG: hypothetical protein MZV64_58775 [Ignavibacteriales bacterium]|nr:hypothetical protein [Ignavibacteriales bacterium]